MNMVKAEMAKRGMVVSKGAAEESSLQNIDMSVFNKGDIFRFMPNLSDVVYDMKMRRSTNVARVVFVATKDGDAKMFYPSTLRKAVQEAKASTVVGENCPLTGVTYVANHEDFDREKKTTDFYEVCQKFPNDLALYQTLAKHQVAVEVKDRKVVEARNFNDSSRIQRQGLMNIEFCLEGAEREELMKTLTAEAEKAVDSAKA